MSDQSWENVGPCNCACCGVATHVGELDDLGWCAPCAEKFAHTCGDCGEYFADASKLTDEAGSGDLRCEPCVGNHNSDQAERAEQQLFEDYHGGVAPDYVYDAMARRAS